MAIYPKRLVTGESDPLKKIFDGSTQGAFWDFNDPSFYSGTSGNYSCASKYGDETITGLVNHPNQPGGWHGQTNNFFIPTQPSSFDIGVCGAYGQADTNYTDQSILKWRNKWAGVKTASTPTVTLLNGYGNSINAAYETIGTPNRPFGGFILAVPFNSISNAGSSIFLDPKNIGVIPSTVTIYYNNLECNFTSAFGARKFFYIARGLTDQEVKDIFCEYIK